MNVKAHKGIKDYGSIGKQFNVLSLTVSSIIRKGKTFHTTSNLPWVATPKKILNRALNRLTRIASHNLKITQTELVNKLETVGINVIKPSVSNALKERDISVQPEKPIFKPNVTPKHNFI